MTKLSFACCLAISAALAACSSVPKAAATGTTVPSVASRVAAAKAQGLLCDDDNMTGSHLVQRVCLTPEQAKQRHEASQGAAFDIQHAAIPKSAEAAPVSPPL